MLGRARFANCSVPEQDESEVNPKPKSPTPAPPPWVQTNQRGNGIARGADNQGKVCYR